MADYSARDFDVNLRECRSDSNATLTSLLDDSKAVGGPEGHELCGLNDV